MEKRKIKFDGMNNPKTGGLNREAEGILKILQKHFEVELSEEPEFLFYSVNSRDYYKYDCVRIFYTEEALCPDFNMADYGIGFEYLEYGDRYLRMPNYFFYPEAIENMLHRHDNISDNLSTRDFCSFVYSNDRAAEYRTELFQQLCNYRKVDSGGKYCNNLADGLPVDNKVEFEKTHKFSIACENTSHPGYHTEKLIEAFAAKTVPIYWGDPLIEKVFNPKAFINCNSYNSIDEMIERVKFLDQHPEEYLAMIKEPALQENISENFHEEMYQRMESYLVHIMEQPFESAFRRNRGFWGQQYLQKIRSEGRVLEKYSKLRETALARMLRKVMEKG